MDNICCVIMAAGQGTRMKSKHPKVLLKVLGRPMCDWVVGAAREAGAGEVCLVVGHQAQAVRAHYEGAGLHFADQPEQRGTAHAIMMARDFLRSHGGAHTLILSGDCPLLTARTISAALDGHLRSGSAATLFTACLPDPFGYGRIVKGADGAVEKIVEQRDASPEELAICEINAGAYWFETAALLDVLDRIEPKNSQNEYYLTDAVGLLRAAGRRVSAYTVEDPAEIMGANTRAQLLELTGLARRRVIDRLMAEGVEFEDISGVSVSPDAVIGRDTVVKKGTVIEGACVIGEDCVLGPDAYIVDSRLGDGVRVNASHILQSSVGSGTTIGPFSQLRPNSHLAQNVKIGNFVEIKNSTVGERTSVAHLTYVGDTDCGGHVNFGCGTVTVNYDGSAKHRTTIGDHVFVGCNTNLVAPVTVADNTYIAAGSTITGDVPEYALAIARARQINKENWVKKQEEKNR
ncbi:bifunctional UDP-N-acetylglucosamine diphosphorylase/glucosamine-1-phosphate N-acetyltransferase GlmU [Feifania hominis]|uniref:Bifunctional protein GlmU n=1 Tax=Feifania hominis TaxID=2763660 RepID=A0A926DFA4_9FIRM|nr:bifunctional UDP-N-acetylglucosamine diphosphorylase/glucosamine-1-phosphate N-acetyltransferase GlmU [Feifania hominis]MBC8537088.1 bifunctional UDP-N-acetylglucosamine diphosphorylase/glucosamine-1-phosphate N-acetyltransferase GlmU [Feifania hominis]